MTLSRRNMLKLGAVAAGAAALPFGLPARADGTSKKLVLLVASGGWDTTYVFDAKPGSQLIDQSAGIEQTLAGLPVYTAPDRPSVTSFFSTYGGLATLVNGVHVQSFVHSDCMKRILSGGLSETTADVAAIVASERGADLPVPYLVLGNSARSGSLASITARAGTTNQISSLLAPGVGGDLLLPSSDFALDDPDAMAVHGYLAGAATRVGSKLPVKSVTRELDAFQRSLVRRDLLRAFAQDNGGFGSRGYTPDLDVQIKVASSALEGGLCHSVMLETGGWDTHDNNSRQAQKFEDLFKSLTLLVQGLENKKLLDDTLVMVVSEMGRTPKLNQANGKDHWPVTSCLVLGGGLPGGRVLGATDDELGAVDVDFQTGAPASDGKQLHTSNLLAAVLQMTGVNPETYFPQEEPFDALGV